MSDDFTFTIQTAPDKAQDETEEGWDTSIMTMPNDWYVEHEGKKALAFQPMARYLTDFFKAQAADLGRELHHADVIISGDRETVRNKALAHDCDECRAAADTCMRYLDENPGAEMLIGTLYWVTP